ncbi:MAG: DNA gyrase C-terminal beta-propeller domain-containing protein, partial [candidate division WOR-3 bacterium]
EIIKIIRNSEDVQIARKILIDKYEFTQEQVNAILELKLQSLTKLEREKILNEYRELEKEISYYQTLLTREDEILNLIKKELQEIKTKYSDKRRTLISKEESEISFDIEDLIQKEETVILITRSGYVKRMSLKSFKSQNRNTKGKTSVKTYEDDMPYEITVCNTHSQLFFITNRARIFWLKAYKIPEMSLTSRGKSITQFFELNQDEKIISILENKNANYIVIITKNGKIKRVSLSEILKGRMGSQIMKLKEDDEVVKCILTLGEEDILIAKEDGKVVRINQSEIPIQSRKGSGVQGVRGKDVISGCIILPSSKVITITQYGYGKKVKEEEIPVLRRGAKGIYIIKAKEKIGNLIEVIDSIQENEDLLITTRRGISLRIDISKLPELSRNAIGVKLIDLQDDDFVSAVSIVR